MRADCLKQRGNHIADKDAEHQTSNAQQNGGTLPLDPLHFLRGPVSRPHGFLPSSIKKYSNISER